MVILEKGQRVICDERDHKARVYNGEVNCSKTFVGEFEIPKYVPPKGFRKVVEAKAGEEGLIATPMEFDGLCAFELK